MSFDPERKEKAREGEIRRIRARLRQTPPRTTGLDAANRMTTAELAAANIGDHDALLANMIRTLAAVGFMCHAVPKALAVDRGGQQAWRTPTRGPKGWQDLTAIRAEDGRIIAVEIKTGSGRPEPGQQAWLDAWAAVARFNPRIYTGVVGPRNVQAFYDAVLPLYGEGSP